MSLVVTFVMLVPDQMCQRNSDRAWIALAEKIMGKATSATWSASTCLTHSRYFGVVPRAFANTGLAGDVR